MTGVTDRAPEGGGREGGEYDWGDVLSELPAGADAAAVRAKVEAAIAEYQCGGAELKRKLWLELERQARSKSVEKIRGLIRRIGPFDPELPDPGFMGASAPNTTWLPRLGDELSRLSELASAHADLYKPRERLVSRLCRAWPGQLSISSEGPLTRFLEKILDGLSVYKDGADGETIKKIIADRVLPRRLIHASAMLTADTSLRCDSEEPSKPTG